MDLTFNAVKISEEKRWDSDSVRNMCIKHNFYTHGSIGDYSKMLNYVDMKKPTTTTIYIVAKDIVSHSDMDAYNQTDAENIESVMFELYRECINTFFHVNEN